MEPQTQPTVTSTPAPAPAQEKKKGSKLAWILVIVFLLTTAGGAAMYMMGQTKLKDAQDSQAAAQKKLGDAETKLSKATFLPTDKYSPQCDESDNSHTALAPVNATPIEGYNVYIVNCISSLIKGSTSFNKVVVFKVEADGNQSFAFGPGSGEPYCISNKILPADAANAIIKATDIPVCKSF